MKTGTNFESCSCAVFNDSLKKGDASVCSRLLQKSKVVEKYFLIFWKLLRSWLSILSSSSYPWHWIDEPLALAEEQFPLDLRAL
jgi:hypothetical protein